MDIILSVSFRYRPSCLETIQCWKSVHSRQYFTVGVYMLTYYRYYYTLLALFFIHTFALYEAFYVTIP